MADWQDEYNAAIEKPLREEMVRLRSQNAAMLEALRALVDHYWPWPAHELSDDHPLSRGRAAIAAATGETGEGNG